MARPLEGVRVIELAAHIAGPACGRLLSDLGAEVIKIESAKGDPWRVTGRDYCPNRYDIDLENPSFDI
ncbi:MAG: CoA transferase, partial [Lachnospiraceae bacterium]|nr:CoA transferase [Candidatus Hippenecus merdae]